MKFCFSFNSLCMAGNRHFFLHLHICNAILLSESIPRLYRSEYSIYERDRENGKTNKFFYFLSMEPKKSATCHTFDMMKSILYPCCHACMHCALCNSMWMGFYSSPLFASNPMCYVFSLTPLPTAINCLFFVYFVLFFISPYLINFII